MAIKLQVPLVARNAMSRSRLLSLLSHDRPRMGLVVAPAGYGKSTLLAQWTEAVDTPVAWVRLDRDDADPVRFWSHVIAALDSAVPGLFTLATSSLAIESITQVLDFVVNQLFSLDHGVVLVLDDYHEVVSSEVDETVQRLIADLPVGTMVVISSRHDPDLAVARWRAAQQLIEIRQPQLRFNEEEVATWLEGHSIEATPQAVRAALEVTEGWPAAFALALRSVVNAADSAAALASFSGEHRHVADYIQEEVLKHNERDLPVLLVAALCPAVNGSLVNHALETDWGGEALRRLERSEVLLEAVDEKGTWYRLHSLVAEYLLSGRDTDAEIRTWMVRAAEWYAADGRPREALDLLLRADEHLRAIELISRSWLEQWRSGQVATLRRDLARIPPEIAANSAPFLVTRAWLLANDGRFRDALSDLRRAESVTDGGPLPDGAPSVEAASATVRSLFALEGLSAAMPAARRADELVDPTSPWRPVVDLGIGYAAFVTGDLATARSAFDRVLVTSDTLLSANAIGWDTVSAVVSGDIESARTRWNEAAQMWANDPPVAKLPAVVLGSATLSCAQGRPIDAAAALDSCRQRLGRSDPAALLEVLVWLAVAEASIGRSTRARKWIDQATTLVERLGGSAWYAERLSEIAARFEPGAATMGRDPGLTARESRILQLLSATHLSQREIGRELGVSFNTIKSHVKAIYIKLGATSREEASQIARIHGLM